MACSRLARAAWVTAGIVTIAACERERPTPAPAPQSAPTNGASLASDAPRIANSVDGVHIEYRVRGRGAPLLVLIHGWSCDSNYWRAQLPALTPKYTVLTVDLAGHGASGRNRSDWTIENFGADVTAAVRHYQQSDPNAPQRIVLIGHSMGGPVAVAAARQLGADVLGIIGVDTFSTLGAPPVPAAEIEKFIAPFERDFIGATREWVSRSMFTKNADPSFVRQIADDMAQAPPDVAIASMRALVPVLNHSDYRDIQVPIVAINADLQGVTDEARARKVAPTFRVVTLPGRGHFLMMEDPAGFNPVLLQEIAKLTS
ncbi:MAG: alpha/beta hydrolase [Steroidobacteraceae bacterium]|nr:alpha/beta hydrolase [Steroidobacteraceae bacterium]MDW8260170.1 alpha/beta hydrolase [Gammaproteobacteria bacterium]